MVVFRSAFKIVSSLAAVGLFCAAIVMGVEGFERVIEAGIAIFRHDHSKGPVVAIMSSTDEFLFSAVLCLMSAAIYFNFVADDPVANENGTMPRWARFRDIGAVKHILIEVALVYMIVDFTTDLASLDFKTDWNLLVMPAAILTIAAASWIMGREH